MDIVIVTGIDFLKYDIMLAGKSLLYTLYVNTMLLKFSMSCIFRICSW